MDIIDATGTRGLPPTPREDQLTKQIERHTARIPSGAFLAVAVGAMALSLVAQVSGRGKWGNFVAQWVPTLLIVGLYNGLYTKMVKLEGHDALDRGAGDQSARPLITPPAEHVFRRPA